MELSTYVQNMVMLIGLGIAVDYSLLMVYRYREEHVLQPSREEAVVKSWTLRVRTGTPATSAG